MLFRGNLDKSNNICLSTFITLQEKEFHNAILPQDKLYIFQLSKYTIIKEV